MKSRLLQAIPTALDLHFYYLFRIFDYNLVCTTFRDGANVQRSGPKWAGILLLVIYFKIYLGSTQSRTQRVQGTLFGKKWPEGELNTHFHPVSRLRIYGALPPLFTSQCSDTGITLSLHLLFSYIAIWLISDTWPKRNTYCIFVLEIQLSCFGAGATVHFAHAMNSSDVQDCI
jgi:hypothetical protein